jgi:hypothetical protein
MLTRTPFRRKDAPPPRPAKQIDPSYTVKPRETAVALVDTAARPVVSYPKQPHVEDGAYLRRVAKLPCVNCGVHGISQAAHPNTDKGVGYKTNDTDAFPLCKDSFMQVGCHTRFDQKAMFGKADRREVEKRWTIQTQRRLGIA